MAEGSKTKFLYEKVSLSNHEKVTDLLQGIVLAATKTQPTIDSKPVTVDVLPDLDNLVVSDKMACVTCDVTFNERHQQVSHYRSDWHRFNIKQKLRGAITVGEDTFSEITGDISSISGSDTESDEEKSPIKVIAETPTVVETNESYHVEGIGRGHPRIFFRNSKDELLSVYRSVVYGKRNQPETGSDLVSMASELPQQLKWVVVMVAGGHFAAAVFNGEKIITHKTFHRYVVRAKRGTAQSAHDNQGGHAKSVGAFMRRHHEAALYEDIRQLLQEWSDHIKTCDRVFLRATGSTRTTLFSGKMPILDKKDSRIRLIPFPTRRPTFNEVKRAHRVESKVWDEISPKKTKTKPDKDIGGKASPVPLNKKSRVQTLNETNKAESESSSDSEDMDLVYTDQVINTQDLQPFECTTRKIRKKKKKKPKGEDKNDKDTLDEMSKAKVSVSEDKVCDNCDKDKFYGLRNELYTAAKIGNCDALQDLIQKLDSLCRQEGESVKEVLNEPIDRDGGTLLHIASTAGRPAIVRLLLGSGTDPTVRDNSGQFSYVICKDKETRNEYRRFMADFPDKYNYTIAQVPGPLTKEMEEEKRSKEAEKRKAQKKAKKEKMKVQKEDEMKQKAEENERQRFLAFSDREKRALAAEKRLVAQKSQKAHAVPVARCFECGEDMTGKVPFEYSDNKFCTSKCLQNHRKSTCR